MLGKKGFTKPDRENPMYQKLWAQLNKEQCKCLTKYNRIPVYGKGDRLFVIPYSRFHNRQYTIDERELFYHVSVQVFTKVNGEYLFQYLRCGGLAYADAPTNVLGIKLLLESDPSIYTGRSSALDSRFDGKLVKGMTLEKSYKLPIDGIGLLGESA